MAITVQYGPMGLAMNLATQAGVGQGNREQSQADLQALGIQNQMQATANQKRAQDMQNALAQQQVVSEANARNAALARQQVLDQQQQNQQTLENSYKAKESTFKDNLAARDQSMQEQQFVNADQQRQQRDAALTRIGTGKATDADYFLFGKTPPAKGMASPDAVETRAELGLMMRQLDDANNALKQHTYSGKSGEVPDQRVPQAIEGHGWDYDAAAQKVKNTQARVDQLTGLLTQYTPKSNAPALPPSGIPPENQVAWLGQAAAEKGIKPAIVSSYPPAPTAVISTLKSNLMRTISDPTKLAQEIVRQLVLAGYDPMKPPVNSGNVLQLR